MASATNKRVVRLVRIWFLLKAQPCTVTDLCAELGVHWTTIYRDLIDLQIDPPEAGCAPMMVGQGHWRVVVLTQD